MPRQIWNEGRVVGFSAYEVYLKHALSIDPNHEPATEKEWLASMMAMGSSMLLRIGTTTEPYIDVPFPADSRLCAANNILASVFTGEGYVGSAGLSEHVWCTKVTDYGPLLDNTENTALAGERQAENMPISSNGTALTDDQIAGIHEYMKIVDGLVLQPGTWIDNPNKPPEKDFVPTTLQKDEATGQETTVTLAHVPTLRIAFSEPVTQPFFILLTGFTNRSVVTGVTGFFDPQRPVDVGYDSAVNTQSPQDGDFLGPWAFPWAAKVIFSVPSAYISYFMNNKYTRELPEGSEAVTVSHDPIIDMKSTDPATFYQNELGSYQYDADVYGDNVPKNTDGTIDYSRITRDPRVPVNIIDLNTAGNGASVISVFQRSSLLPPALYGAHIASTAQGPLLIYPLDNVAFGALKLYHGDISNIQDTAVLRAKQMELESPGVTGLMRDKSSYVIYEYNEHNSIVPVSEDYYASLYGVLQANEPMLPYFTFQHNLGMEPGSVGWGIVASRRLFGNLSTAFQKEFGITYSTSASSIYQKLISYGVNDSMCDQIDTDDKSKYYYILRGPKNGVSQGAQWALVPIKIDDGRIDFIEKWYYNSDTDHIVWVYPPFTTRVGYWSVDTDPNHLQNDNGVWVKDRDWTAEEFETYDNTCSNFDLLGTWWGGEVREGHTTIGQYLKSKLQRDSFITNSDRLIPITDVDGKSWEDIYAETKLSDVLGSYPELTAGLHPDILSKDLTLKEIVELSRLYNLKTNEALTYVDEYGIKHAGREITMYVAKASDISAELRKATPDLSNVKPAVSFSAYVDANNQNKTQVIPIPDKYQYTDGPLAAVGISGNHQTISLSMADKDNNLYPLSGDDGVISSTETEIKSWDDMLHWDILVNALAYNKSIDILGSVLRGLKSDLTGSGPDHLEFANGLRLYVSNTKPTDTDIPDGSIGIGW